MALFRHFGVKHAEGGQVTPEADKHAKSLVRRTEPSAAAQSLDFLELTENCTFLNRKLTSALKETLEGHELGNLLAMRRQEYNRSEE
jgi:hypothetical protein